MTQDIEARLVDLAKAARSQFGETIFTDRPRLASYLQGEAPELRLQIKAFTAAMQNSYLDAQAIAAQENMDMTSAGIGVSAAKALGPSAPAAPPQPNQARDDDWVGDSMPVGAAPPPPNPTPPPAAVQPDTASAAAADEPWYKNKIVLLAGAAAVGLFLFNQSGGQQQGPQPNPQPGPQLGPKPGPNNGPTGNIPTLVAPGASALPIVQLQRNQNGAFVSFAIPSANGNLYGMVTIANGQLANGGMVGFTNNPQGNQMQTLSQPGMFSLGQNGNMVGRVMEPIWQYDQLGIQNICLVFEQQGGQDVQLNGSQLCIYNADCNQAMACGQVRQ